MKKQILSAILMAAVILTTTACSGKTEVSEPSSPSESEVTAEAAPESTPAATAEKQEQAEAATTAPEEAAEPVELLNITDNLSKISLCNGSWSFMASNGVPYLYSIAENKLYELDPDYGVISDYTRAYKIGDLIYYYYNYRCNYVVNAVTNEVVYKNGERIDGLNFRHINPETGRMLVTKVSESASGDVISIGVINSKQEWEYPLTEFTIDGFTTDDLKVFDLLLMGDYVLLHDHRNNCYFYSLKDKSCKLVWENSKSGGLTPEYPKAKDKELIYASEALYVLDDSGECKKIYDLSESNYFSFSFWGDDSIGFKTTAGNKTDVILSWNDYKDLCEGFDLSKYHHVSIIDINENTIIFAATNPNFSNPAYIAYNDMYNIIMNKDGSLVTKPFSVSTKDAFDFCGDWVVINNKIINCKTGDSKEFEIIQTGNNTDRIAVKDGGYWYLVDLSDPDALLNPFELAAQ